MKSGVNGKVYDVIVVGGGPAGLGVAIGIRVGFGRGLGVAVWHSC